MSARFLLPAALVLAIAGLWMSGLLDALSWAGLAREQASLTAWVAAHPFLSPLLFVLIYAASATLSLPQGALLSITGGLLFGTLAGGALAVTGATIGAVCLFTIVRSSFGDRMTRRGGPRLIKLRDALRRDGFSYLLALRLIPLVPFWLINLAAPLAGVRPRVFAAATFLGIAPAAFIMASIGAGLRGVLSRGERPDLSVIVSLPVLGPLLALAALSMTPILWKRWRAHGERSPDA